MEREEQDRQARAAYTRAMAAFKAECPPVIAKDATVSFGKGQGATNYKHATLGGILGVATPHLSAHGLSVDWDLDQTGNGGIEVTCVVTHEDGHSERRSLPGPLDGSGSKNKIQQMGSTITYLQRYTLTAALGLSTGEVDDDGRGPEPKSDDRPKQLRGNDQQQRPQHREEDYPPKGAQPPQEAAQPQEVLADWVPGYLARLKVLGALRADLEGSAGRGLGKPATEWGDAEKPLIEAIGAALKAVDPGKRPALVRDLFELSAGATEG
jgi:hypothetical protein